MSRLSLVVVGLAFVACRQSSASASSAASTPPPATAAKATPQLAQNAKALQADGGQVRRWTSRDAWRLRILGEGLDWYLKVGSFCPGAAKAEAREASDEFEEKDRDRAVQALRRSCFNATRDESSGLPTLVSLEMPVADGKYSFEDHIYRLSLPQGTIYDDGKVIALALDDDTSDVSRLRHTIEGSWNSFDHALMVALHGSSSGAFRLVTAGESKAESGLVFDLPAEEGAARKLKPLLAVHRVAVAVAFEPERFTALCARAGSSSVFACTGADGEIRITPAGHQVSGLVGRAVGYRVVVGDAPLTAWIPFGFDSAGAEAKVATVSDVPSMSKERRRSRDRDSENDDGASAERDE